MVEVRPRSPASCPVLPGKPMMMSAVTGVSRTPVYGSGRWARTRPAIRQRAQHRGVCPGVPGRSRGHRLGEFQLRDARYQPPRASRSSSHRPPAVTRVSGPRSSWVRSHTSSPLSAAPGTTDEPRTMPADRPPQETIRGPQPGHLSLGPAVTGGTQSAGSPSMARRVPASPRAPSSPRWIVEPSARRTPPARFATWLVRPVACTGPAGPVPSPSPGTAVTRPHRHSAPPVHPAR